MKTKTTILAGAFAFATLSLPVEAQPLTGLYLGGGLGANWLQESDLSSQDGLRTALGAAGIGQSGTATFDIGWAGVLSLGWGFGNGFRAEVEGSYRRNSLDGISGFPGIQVPRSQGGDIYSYGVMANVFYDFDLGWNFGGFGVVPYLGAGAGYVVQNWDNVNIRGPNGQINIDGDNGNFAYQLIAGAAFPIARVPGLSLTAEYRFMQALSDDVDATFRPVAGGTITSRGAVEVENANHSILIGLRYAFNPPRPAPVIAPVPAPAAAPAPARTYLVFFDFDRADLTDRARQIIADASQASRTLQTTRIEVAGHADRSGTPQYNQRLSMRRAEAVAMELVRHGVSRNAINVQAFGESRPLVPTADGVREPQNRRVEIVL
jgi:OOP family OmpA-OmpF porin